MMQYLRIAVADDEPDMRDYFKKSLSRLGHQVVAVAQNGRELVEQCRAVRPDLVITDIKMPDMDGIDAATQIDRDGPIPVILVSAFHEPELIARAEADHISSSRSSRPIWCRRSPSPCAASSNSRRCVRKPRICGKLWRTEK
jgi:response regulator NasT